MFLPKRDGFFYLGTEKSWPFGEVSSKRFSLKQYITMALQMREREAYIYAILLYTVTALFANISV